MSWEALASVEQLRECPDGARLAPAQKYLAHILARYHNLARRRAYPSLATLAREMNTDKSTVKRYLAYLEVHGVIRKLRPEKSGRTWTLSYSFPQIDDAAEPEAITADDTKGVQVAPLFSPEERGSKGVHPEQKGGQKGFSGRNAIRKKLET